MFVVVLNHANFAISFVANFQHRMHIDVLVVLLDHFPFGHCCQRRERKWYCTSEVLWNDFERAHQTEYSYIGDSLLSPMSAVLISSIIVVWPLSSISVVFGHGEKNRVIWNRSIMSIVEMSFVVLIRIFREIEALLNNEIRFAGM